MHKISSRQFSSFSVPMNSKGRMFKEKKSFFRNPYQRDRDRIIHSTAFRRLKHKTQVFVNTSSDHFRTRITHSMEVAQIARTLAKNFNLNEDLCETISLAHDLGHTPFGHAGEETLNECMLNFGGFDHNIQTIRVVSILENKYYDYRGLNLTIETLDGLVKHNGPIYDPDTFDNILGNNFFKNRINFLDRASLEAQIASISDDIAYNSHDLEDGLKANLFKVDELKDIPILSNIIEHNKKKISRFGKDLFLRQLVRLAIDEMVKDVIKNINKNIKEQKIKKVKDIYKLDKNIVYFSPKMSSFDSSIKEFLAEKMYNHKEVVARTKQGKNILEKLFNHIKKNPRKYINKNRKRIDSKERYVCDFIAGMTDRYAINLYKSLK